MAEEAKDITAATTEATGNTTTAASENTEQQIPYSRFREVNAARKAAEDRLAILEAADAKRKEKEALEAGKFQEVIDDLKPKAERVKALEAALQTYLDAELADIPEDRRDLIPTGDITDRLTWVKNAKAKGLFGTPKAPSFDAGATGDRTKALPKLSADEMTLAKQAGMTPEQYAEYKARRSQAAPNA